MVRAPCPLLSDKEPMLDPASLKTKVPVGVPPALLTVAVKVTDWPNTVCVAEEARVVALVVVPVSVEPISATKALVFPLLNAPFVDWIGFLSGKSEAKLKPVTNAFPDPSTAMPFPWSSSVPPK